MDISPVDHGSLAFGGFRLDPQRRVLTHAEEVVKLAPKAFDLLLHLVHNPGRLVEKEELLSAVWGGRYVEEGNLNQTIFSIRKALGREPGSERWIVTAPGRGYRFTAPVTRDVPADLTPISPVLAPEPGPADPAIRPRRRFALGVIAMVLVVAGFAAWHATFRPAPAVIEKTAAGPPSNSVAVLAFANMTGDPAQDYFSDGLADELINTLSRISALKVAARTSAFSFKGNNATIAEIARKLNVAAVLEGSVLREAGQVRVNVQLINTSTGFPFWSRTYDHDLGNILTSQADIASSVAGSLQLSLLGNALPRLVAGGTHDPDALDAYLRGTSKLHAQDPAAALADFDLAINKDGLYALARVGRSQALREIVASQDGDAVQMARMEERSIAEAERAVALAPDLGVAHANLGVALQEGRFDFRGAEREIARARDLAPGDAFTNRSYGALQGELGHAEEALDAARFAVAIDPLSPKELTGLAGRLSFARQYDKAIAAVHEAERLRGKASWTDRYLVGELEFMRGNYQAALELCAGKSWPLLHCRAITYNKLGRQKDAEEALTQLRTALGDAGAMQYATIYAQWGRPEQAIPWLETAYRIRDPGLEEMQVLPLLDPIRGTATFKEVERRMDFPP